MNWTCPPITDTSAPRNYSILSGWLHQQKERRGLTLSQIERLATDVENYYHDLGLKLTKAYLPRQATRADVLVIEVMNGKHTNWKFTVCFSHQR